MFDVLVALVAYFVLRGISFIVETIQAAEFWGIENSLIEFHDYLIVIVCVFAPLAVRLVQKAKGDSALAESAKEAGLLFYGEEPLFKDYFHNQLMNTQRVYLHAVSGLEAIKKVESSANLREFKALLLNPEGRNIHSIAANLNIESSDLKQEILTSINILKELASNGIVVDVRFYDHHLNETIIILDDVAISTFHAGYYHVSVNSFIFDLAQEGPGRAYLRRFQATFNSTHNVPLLTDRPSETDE
ncbi:MAG: hypothetical protein OCC46_09235 [Pseudodesulfovibrio sp.]